MSAHEAPPSYDVATGSSANTTSHSHDPSHLSVPNAPRASRKSMEDEVRPLPEGWVRQWDTKEHHQFFVDTKADPPRAIWVHPIDDPEVWNSLPSAEKERLQAADEQLKRPHTPPADHHYPDEKPSQHHNTKDSSAEHYPSELPPRPGAGHHTHSHATSASGDHKKPSLGERLKTKVTGMTKEEREAEKARQAEEEAKYYEAHQRFRAALNKAQITGQPQFFGKDRNGQDIYIEPPQAGYGGGGAYGGGFGGGGYGYPNRGYGYNPYTSGMYGQPNARYIRPQYGYGRPGYGGGYGLPLAGGLLGGALLGGLLF